jgi:hypothetical protein
VIMREGGARWEGFFHRFHLRLSHRGCFFRKHPRIYSYQVQKSSVVCPASLPCSCRKAQGKRMLVGQGSSKSGTIRLTASGMFPTPLAENGAIRESSWLGLQSWGVSFTKFLFQAGTTIRTSLVPSGTVWQESRDCGVSPGASSS